VRSLQIGNDRTVFDDPRSPVRESETDQTLSTLLHMTDNNRKVATVDKRPFFEKALSYGVKSGIIDQARCATIIADGAKGTVQVADHFGTSHLYADLDNARRRIVNLVSLYLEHSFGTDLEQAARSLRDDTFLSHSRGGNELLKKLYALPESAIFGDVKAQSLKAFQDEHTLSKPYSLSAYRKEHEQRQDIEATLAAARWFAGALDIPRPELDLNAAETVIRTALLVWLGGGEKCPGRGQFAQLIDALRTKGLASGTMRVPKTILEGVPEEYREIADGVRRQIEKHDAPLIVNAGLKLDAVFHALESRYFVFENGLEDVDSFDAYVSKEWHQVTNGKDDPYSRLTLFMCLASGAKPQTTVTDTEARAMVRRVRKDGIDSNAVTTFIMDSAPFEIKNHLLSLWEEEFLPEAQERLLDESDTKYIRALQFLEENCNIESRKKSAGKKA
jgi:hypothetical protein